MVSPLDYTLGHAAWQVIAAASVADECRRELASREARRDHARAWFHGLRDALRAPNSLDPAIIADDMGWAGTIIAAGLIADQQPAIRVALRSRARDLYLYVTPEFWTAPPGQAQALAHAAMEDWTTRATAAAGPAYQRLSSLARPSP